MTACASTPIPLGVEHEGRTILFVEDFPHATGKALISAVAFDANGPVGTPVPVLEEPHHLSYPFVFEREGSFWMIPEKLRQRHGRTSTARLLFPADGSRKRR